MIIPYALHWTEYFKALGPTVVACLVAYIAWQQWVLSKYTFREKMFDRRMQIYSTVSDAIDHVIRHGRSSGIDGSKPSYARLHEAWHDSRFLFGNDVSEYIKELSSRLIDMECCESLIAHHRLEKQEDLRKEQVEKHHELLNSLIHEHDKKYAVFKAYLSFK